MSVLRALLPATAMLAAALPAPAETLVTSLSHQRVQITSSFTGEDLVIFGTIEGNQDRRQRAYDIAVTVIGPRQAMVTRRKAHRFGLWVNADARVFVDPPIYLAVLSSRPLADFAPPALRRKQQLGLDNFLLRQQIGSDIADVVPTDAFRMAFLRLKQEQGLYYERPHAVSFLTSVLYRATIPLPGNVPVGHYSVETALFADGALVARTTSGLDIIKAGFEQVVADAAHSEGVLYGVATTAMALLTGWFAAVVFRRD